MLPDTPVPEHGSLLSEGPRFTALGEPGASNLPFSTDFKI